MTEQQKEVVICGPLGKVGILFQQMLTRDMRDQPYLVTHDNSFALLQSRKSNYESPHSIVCDLNNTPIRQACSIILCLRRRFPETGMVVLREDAQLEMYTDRLHFTTVFASILGGMYWRPKATRCILEAAQVSIRGAT